jgi:hypothetical protein
MRRYGRPIVALMAAVGLLAVSTVAPAPAVAEPVLDANCPGPSTGSVLTMAGGRRAQTFTAQTTGTLVRGEMEIHKEPGSSGDYVMQVHTTDGAGVPTDTVLASATLPNGPIPSGVSRIAGSFDAPASVVAGQVYALVLTRSSAFHNVERGGNACPGQEFRSGSSGPWTPDDSLFDLLFSVFVEPAPQSADLITPIATITKGPKDKTKKKQATFEFTGTDARAVASLQCSLDGGAFAACTSPYTVKVKKGKHTFSVRAVDQAGNVGPPASDDWKRKKKRKK